MNLVISQLPPQSVWIGVGLLVAAALAAGLGRARGVPASEVLGLFGVAVLAGAVVSRFSWLVLDPGVDVGLVLSEPAAVIDPRSGGHSSFGAMVGGAAVLGLWLWQRREAWALTLADALVCGGLAGLALARIGCLANGCDFGARTQLSWAIRHPAGSEAFASHLHRGWVAADAAWSAPVHPFALLLAVGTIVIVGLGAWLVVTRRCEPGGVAFGVAGAYLLWRFAVEWTRDPATVVDWGGGFNVHHLLAIAGLGIVMGAFVRLGACGRLRTAQSSNRSV